MDRIERHDVLNAAMLSFMLLGMTFTMLWGARSIVGATTGDEPTVDVLANQAEDEVDFEDATDGESGDGADGSAAVTLPADETPTSSTPATTTITTVPVTTTTAAPTTTAAVLHPPNEVITRVGNGASKGGVAGAGTNILAAAGYAALSPKNAETIDVSVVYYLPGYSKDAEAVAGLLSVSPSMVQPMPSNPGMPVGEAQVVAVLGKDTPHGN